MENQYNSSINATIHSTALKMIFKINKWMQKECQQNGLGTILKRFKIFKLYEFKLFFISNDEKNATY